MTSEDRRISLATGRGFRLAALLLTLLGWASGTALAARGASRVVRYRGYGLIVPDAWPVYNLVSDPTVCVRFNRHAVYLGRPSSEQRCPAHAVGRTEAILVSPLVAHTGAGSGTPGSALAPTGSLAAQPRGGSALQMAVASHGVMVTATWAGHPDAVQRALGVRSLAGVAAAAASPTLAPAGGAGSAGPPAGPGAVYTGLGFDPCSAPSPAQMSAWGSSPYHAVGIYIGGANMGCSQPNLSPAWVSHESAVGWHLIPTYVGLQAPSNSCGCASITPSQASSQGTAAAIDALSQAGALGIGTGNPIYYDLEAYQRGGTSTSSVLGFLSAWTTQLHAAGYLSGVYSSAASGMVDLAAQIGTGYEEPDDIWIADWNGAQTTSDPYVPSADWSLHQRLHQYDGGHNETYGKVTINIDGDYLDGATAAAGSGTSIPPPVAAAPSLRVSPGGDGTIHLYAKWVGATGVQGWRVLAGDTPEALAPLGGAARPTTQVSLTVPNALPYFAIQALGAGEQVLATSPAVATPAHVAIYGHSVFAPLFGLGGLPVGCFEPSACEIATTITAGSKVIASTGREFIPAGGGGIVYLALSSAGRAMLMHAPGHRLPVRVRTREASGASATRTLSVVQFSSSGRGPRRSVTQSSTIRIVGVTDFVSPGGVGGILAGCYADVPCEVTTNITAAGMTIARTGPEFLGAHQLGYLFFELTRRGGAMLTRSRGNQLGARVRLTAMTASADGGSSPTATSATATAAVALVRFR